MDKDILEAINDLKDEIKEKQNFIDILENLNINEVLTEEKWHQICETGLRPTKIMEKFLLNIFPEATDVKVYVNEVRFSLYGFKCAIPTSRCQGIQIDTSWYFKNKEKPKLYIPNELLTRLELINANKNHFSWYEKALIREKLTHRKICKLFLFFLWFFNWKWEKLDESFYFDRISEYEEKYKYSLHEYETLINEKNNKLDVLFNKLIPVLSTFSSNFWRLDQCRYSIEEIKKNENIQLAY